MEQKRVYLQLRRMKQKISLSKLLDTIRQFEPGTLVAMEACATSHFGGRTFASMGYCVKLIPAQHVKAFALTIKMMPMMRWQFARQHFAQVFQMHL